MSIPAEIPADVTMPPSSTHLRFSKTVSEGNISLSSSTSAQWVVALLPSSRPACASKKAPVQTDAVSLAVAAVR